MKFKERIQVALEEKRKKSISALPESVGKAESIGQEALQLCLWESKLEGSKTAPHQSSRPFLLPSHQRESQPAHAPARVPASSFLPLPTFPSCSSSSPFIFLSIPSPKVTSERPLQIALSFVGRVGRHPSTPKVTPKMLARTAAGVASRSLARNAVKAAAPAVSKKLEESSQDWEGDMVASLQTAFSR